MSIRLFLKYIVLQIVLKPESLILALVSELCLEGVARGKRYKGIKNFRQSIVSDDRL